MKVLCCACGIFLRDQPSAVFDDDAVSHGLCGQCASRFMSQVGTPLHDYLEGLQAPVITVTCEGLVSSANSRALRILGKSPDQVQGLRGGDVFECEYARLPGGCGHTVHCSGCAIRMAVMYTLATGLPRKRIPASLQKTGNPPPGIDLLISTEKKGGIVFLTIEEAGIPDPA